jgi:putative SOS response-associated peptidase YedK
MCANYRPTPRDVWTTHFGFPPPPEPHPPESFPGYLAPFIRVRNAVMTSEVGTFGLMPHWARPQLFRSTYNARSETAETKPSFRDAWKKRQWCIIPAASIFEPNYESGKAVRWEISHRTGRPVGIAGLWEWRPGEGDGQLSFTMLTVNADDHALMRQFHKPDEEKRMVVLLEPRQYEDWLRADHAEARAMLTQYPADQLAAAPAPLPPRGKRLSEAA